MGEQAVEAYIPELSIEGDGEDCEEVFDLLVEGRGDEVHLMGRVWGAAGVENHGELEVPVRREFVELRPKGRHTEGWKEMRGRAHRNGVAGCITTGESALRKAGG